VLAFCQVRIFHQALALLTNQTPHLLLRLPA